MEKHTDGTQSHNKHVQRSERTRAALIGAARELFAERGYADVPTEEVVRRAGVTRGALYHQFAGKEALFAAVLEQVEEELTARIAEGALAAGVTDPLAALAAGADVYLDACLEPEVQRITILDAPAVLGWDAWRELGARYGLGIVRGALEAAIEAGRLAPAPVDPLAHMLLAALEEGALYIGRADDPARAREEVGATVRRILEGLG